MSKLNELIIDGVKTSSFLCDILVETRPKLVVSMSKTVLHEHDGINGAILQTNKRRGLIEKSYHISLIEPSDEEIYKFSALLNREKFWLENEQEKSVKYWCYKVTSYEIGKDDFGAWVVDVTFICHPTKFFKTVDSQILKAENLSENHSVETIETGPTLVAQKTPKKTVNTDIIWIDTSYKRPSEDIYIKYSSHSDGRNMSDVPNNYIGVTSSLMQTAPENPSDYIWYRLPSTDVSFVWSNSKDGKLDYTEVAPQRNAAIVAKSRPRVEHTASPVADNGSLESAFRRWNTWEFAQWVKLKPSTTYTLTARGCQKGYKNENSQYYELSAYVELVGDLGIITFKNTTYETKHVTFTTPANFDPEEHVLIVDSHQPDRSNWAGACIDWYVLSEGSQAYTEYPNDIPAKYMAYRYFGIKTLTEVITEETELVQVPSKPMQVSVTGRSGGIVKTQGSALAFPKITIRGNSQQRVSFTVGNQRIELESLNGEAIMINDPNQPSFKMSNGDLIKWSGDFITIDPTKENTVGVSMSAGIESLVFETVWGWA